MLGASYESLKRVREFTIYVRAQYLVPSTSQHAPQGNCMPPRQPCSRHNKPLLKSEVLS